MGRNYWYEYEQTAEPSGPFYESKTDAIDDADEPSNVRPIDESVLVANAEIIHADDAEESDDPESTALAELDHDELKALAEEKGVAEEIDLRSKDSIIDGLRESNAV